MRSSLTGFILGDNMPIKLSNKQWNLMNREQKQEAVLNFQEPDEIYTKDRVDDRKFRGEKI